MLLEKNILFCSIRYRWKIQHACLVGSITYMGWMERLLFLSGLHFSRKNTQFTFLSKVSYSHDHIACRWPFKWPEQVDKHSLYNIDSSRELWRMKVSWNDTKWVSSSKSLVTFAENDVYMKWVINNRCSPLYNAKEWWRQCCNVR